jgi:hypothetical protein
MQIFDIFDFFYEEYILPAWESYLEFSENVIELFIKITMFLTVPVWLPPYLIIKYIKSRKETKK